MALIEKLEAIGDAIRSKTGETALLSLDQMPNAIAAIEGGGDTGLTEEDVTITGDAQYFFSSGKLLSLNDKVHFKFNDIIGVSNMFYEAPKEADLSKITINLKNTSNLEEGVPSTNLFYYSASNTLPTINGRLSLKAGTFSSVYYLTDEVFNAFLSNPNLTFTWKEPNMNPSQLGLQQTLYNARSLRNPTPYFHKIQRDIDSVPITSTALKDYYYGFCYGLTAADEIIDYPVFEGITAANTSNMFSNAFGYCLRAKNITFATKDGAPYVKKWKSQTIDLTSYVGYVVSDSYIIGYNSGITTNDKAPTTDYPTFQAFIESNPDNWYTTDLSYSRYTRESAVNTINSLPDTSAYLATAGGTNTIKFKKNSGAGRGLNVSDLSAQEIAVATAKGWTVTFA